MEINNKEDCIWILNKINFDNFTFKDLKSICKTIKETNSYTNFVTEEIRKQNNHIKPKLSIVK